MLVTAVVVAAAGRTEGLSWVAQEMDSHKVASSDASRDVAVAGVWLAMQISCDQFMPVL